MADLAKYVSFGASPRASIHLIEAARALAFLRGREYVLPEDVTDLAPDVLRHRLVLTYEALAEALSRGRADPARHAARSRRPTSRSRPMSGSPRSPERILRRLEWTVIRRLDGLLHGDYRTLFRGFGLDLADLREYQYHDDVRHIDWNVTARLQTPYVREYHEDREVTAWFLLDLSPSVDFGSRSPEADGVDRVRHGPRAAPDPPRQPGRGAVLREQRGCRDPAAERPAARAPHPEHDAFPAGAPARVARPTCGTSCGPRTR